jgi:hypothetical protein
MESGCQLTSTEPRLPFGRCCARAQKDVCKLSMQKKPDLMFLSNADLMKLIYRASLMLQGFSLMAAFVFMQPQRETS